MDVAVGFHIFLQCGKEKVRLDWHRRCKPGKKIEMTWPTMWTMCCKRTSEDVGNGSPIYYRENKLRLRNYNCTYMVCTIRIYIQRCRDLPSMETVAECMNRRYS